MAKDILHSCSLLLKKCFKFNGCHRESSNIWYSCAHILYLNVIYLFATRLILCEMKKFLSRFSTLYMSGECVLSTLLSILVDDPVGIKKLYGKVCVILAYKFYKTKQGKFKQEALCTFLSILVDVQRVLLAYKFKKQTAISSMKMQRSSKKYKKFLESSTSAHPTRLKKSGPSMYY